MPQPEGGPVVGREQLNKLVCDALRRFVRSGEPIDACIADVVNNAELVVYKHEAGITLVVQNAAFGHRLGGPEVGMQVKVLLRVPLDAEALTEIHRIMGRDEGEM